MVDERTPAVLIVDDNPLIVNVLQSLFQAERYDVCACANGLQALEILKKKAVDVIICDVMMPEMDGYQLHERIRQRPELAHIPFVFLTALSDNIEIDRGRETGADDYLVKPFDPRNLISLVRGKVKRSRSMRKLQEEQYNSYRKKVIHTLSHEFRTPLVAISTGTELLLEQSKGLDPKAFNLVQAIQRGGQRLERLVNDFMLLQQLEAGTAQKLFDTRSQRVSLDRVVREFIADHSKELEEAGFTVTYRMAGSDREIVGYEPQLGEMLARIISNAVKFRRDDLRIEITLRFDKDNSILDVRDHGIGIDPQRVREALEAFGQIDREKYEQQGSGVGLAIAARYARIHKGEIRLERHPEGGSVATLRIPLAP